ncbi:MAG: GNAT family N-acetyltransferase [Bacilli bacterium]|nr:GNAT family N-acetyltransferase [Bacilli bacterium]
MMFTAILIGAGARGIGVYGEYAANHQNELKFVGVAEPDPMRRQYFAAIHQIPGECQFIDHQEILAQGRIADVCFICTQDHLHIEPAIKAIELGYDVFLEKPMAVTPDDCLLLERLAKENGTKLMIGHVLRYTEFFSQIKKWLEAGKIGKLMSIQHNENVSYWHQAHSYVRGNWRNEATSSPMILAKSCHDLDLLIWYASSKPVKVSSFGELSHFKAANAPEGSPTHCMDGCPIQDTCPYFAPRVYLNAPIWMKLPVSNDMSDESLLKALKKGPYGRCVYRSDNDVVDHQVTIVEFENEVTAAFTMTGFTHDNTRTIKLMGTDGEIRGHLEKNELELIPFGEDSPTRIVFEAAKTGHGGGDEGIMKAFVKLINSSEKPDERTLEDSVGSHLLAFAAEASRKQMKTIFFSDYLATLGDLDYGCADKKKRISAIRLATKCFSQNMRNEYPLLLGKANQSHMFVATKGKEVVSMVNYYLSTVKLDRVKLRVGSIGSVATNEAYRKRGIAGKLLKLAENKMLDEKVSLVIISGDGPLYERYGSTRVGDIIAYKILRKAVDSKSKYTLTKYDESHFSELKRLHHKEKYRYLRSDTEFKKLIAGQTFPGETFENHLYLIQDKDKTVAYVFFNQNLLENRILIKEYAGSRKAIQDCLGSLIASVKADYAIVSALPNDEINRLLNGHPCQNIDQYASFKVLDWQGFFENLSPYIQSHGIGSLSLKKKSQGYLMHIDKDDVSFKTIHEVHKFIFGPNKDLLESINDAGLKKKLTEVFPIPFVWTNNLNYQ